MRPIMQKLGMLAAMLSIFLSVSAYGFEVDGIYYNITDSVAKEVESTFYSPGGYSGDIVVPSSVTYEGADYKVTAIGVWTFSWCRSLTSITLPNTVTTVGDYAFDGCCGLTTITIPNTVTAIGARSFNGCTGLTTIDIPGTVKTIGKGAFYGCSGLTTVTIPGSVTSIGENTFRECSRLTSIEVADDNEAYSSKDGILYNKSQTTLICCPDGKAGDIIIPNTVTTVDNDVFTNCISLTNIEVADDNEVYSSKDGVLYNKSQTTLICCPGGKAGEIIIPGTVTTIGDSAFWECRGLTSIVIPNSVTTIEDSAFWECRGLTSIIIPNSVTTIEDSAFWECIGLTSIDIPNSVTTIGAEAFSWCSGLTTISIPGSVTTIGESAFLECRGVTSITSLAVTPPECGDFVFERIDKQKCTLHVPAGSLETYKQAPGWKDFNLVAEVETGIDSIEAGLAAGTTEVFNLAGEKVAAATDNLPAGIYIVREGLTARKIVVR